MNARFLTVLTVASVLASSPGCSGVRNFIFGRGARCGLCSKLPLPRFGQPPVAPCAPTCAPAYPAPVYAPAQVYAPETCNTCYSPVADCGCSDSAGYAPMIGAPTVVDPYNQSGGLPMGGGTMYGESPYMGQGAMGNGMLQGDGFDQRANRVDYDGAKILSEEPLPPGARPSR